MIRLEKLEDFIEWLLKHALQARANKEMIWLRGLINGISAAVQSLPDRGFAALHHR